MQIMIDIPDGYVGVIMANQRMEGSAMDKLIRQAVIDGTILPEGHGRLIDADELTENTLCKTFGLRSVDIENATTIIEADRGDEE